ncbi:MAG: hypothetical protein HY313_11340 [Acidobacteria bacterium]|nr:hypothetical protein [Acidobacteriota bacterium]
MADELGWPVEEIPDAELVFMRARREHIRDGELQPGVFRSHGNGMSVNWERYASAEETKQQAQLVKKDPDNYAVISMPVIRIRRIDDLRVEHTPEPTNRAHSDVFGLPQKGEQLTEIRLRLRDIATIVISLTL